MRSELKSWNIGGVYEYSGAARSGKTTLMMGDLMNKLLNKYFYEEYVYRPDEVWANYVVFLDGVNCVNNEKMLWVLNKARAERWRHKVFMVDECSQPPLFYARNSRDDMQTKLVTSLWQMPKLGTTCLYSSNLGNSVDVQMRDATWASILPLSYHHNPEDRSLETLDFRVVNGMEVWEQDMVLLNPAEIQEYFDSFAPVV